MAEKRDYYDVLGVNKNASAAELKEAYKRLAKKFHPDVSKEPHAEEKFKEANEAYSVLSDAEKKANYDRFGFAGPGGAGFDGAGFGGFQGADFDFDSLFGNLGGFGFGDLFGEAFGGGRRRPRGPVQGDPIKVEVSLSFEEAAFGATKEIEVERHEACEACGGSGSKGGERTACGKCRGSGMVQHVQRTAFGLFSTTSPCHACQGKGSVARDVCLKCRGHGKVNAVRKIQVKVPPGVWTGNHLRLTSEGNAGERGGRPGDLFVVLFVEPHDVFRRDGADVYCKVPLGFAEAALGAEIEVPTLEGRARLKVPPGTQTGTVFRLKGKGVKELDSNRFGDEYVKVFVKVPEKLGKEERELLERLAELDGKNLRDDSLLGKFKRKFGG